MAVEGREEFRIARERPVAPLPLAEEPQAPGHNVGMGAVAMRVPGAEKSQQREARHAVVALRAGAVAMVPVHAPLHAAAMPHRAPAAVARLRGREPGERRLHRPLRLL